MRVTPILGLIGLLLMVLVVVEPKRGLSEGASQHLNTSSYWDDIKYLVKKYGRLIQRQEDSTTTSIEFHIDISARVTCSRWLERRLSLTFRAVWSGGGQLTFPKESPHHRAKKILTLTSIYTVGQFASVPKLHNTDIIVAYRSCLE